MTGFDPRHMAWRLEFQSLGEEVVRMLAGDSQVVVDDRILFSRIWLKQQEEARAAAITNRRDLREEEILRISRKALRHAWWSNLIAILALMLAAVAIYNRP